MNAHFNVSRTLADNIAAVTPEDDRKPLPKRVRPLDAPPMPKPGGLARDCLRVLQLHGELEPGQIAARLLQREEDVERALLCLALAHRAVKLSNGYTARWKSIVGGEEDVQ